jgi:hypothetical protein
LLVAGKGTGITPEDSVLRDMVVEVGLVLHLPGFEKSGLGADQFLLNVGKIVGSLSRSLGYGWEPEKTKRD